MFLYFALTCENEDFPHIFSLLSEITNVFEHFPHFSKKKLQKNLRFWLGGEIL